MRNTISALVASGALCGVASAQTILNAHPPPANNGGSAGWAIFMDFESHVGNLRVTELVTANTASAGARFDVETFVRTGAGLGAAGSSSAGWTSLGVVTGVQGAAGSTGVSETIDIPDIAIDGSGITGVAFLFTNAGPRYLGTGSPPYTVFDDGRLKLTTGDSRTAPFTTGGSVFSSRALVGSVTYIPAPGTLILVGVGGVLAARRRR